MWPFGTSGGFTPLGEGNQDVTSSRALCIRLCVALFVLALVGGVVAILIFVVPGGRGGDKPIPIVTTTTTATPATTITAFTTTTASTPDTTTSTTTTPTTTTPTTTPTTTTPTTTPTTTTPTTTSATTTPTTTTSSTTTSTTTTPTTTTTTPTTSGTTPAPIPTNCPVNTILTLDHVLDDVTVNWRSSSWIPWKDQNAVFKRSVYVTKDNSMTYQMFVQVGKVIGNTTTVDSRFHFGNVERTPFLVWMDDWMTPHQCNFIPFSDKSCYWSGRSLQKCF